MKHKLFRIMAIMESHNDEEPIVFSFNLPGMDEKGVGMTLSKMDSIKRVISVEEISEPLDEVYNEKDFD